MAHPPRCTERTPGVCGRSSRAFISEPPTRMTAPARLQRPTARRARTRRPEADGYALTLLPQASWTRRRRRRKRPEPTNRRVTPKTPAIVASGSPARRPPQALRDWARGLLGAQSAEIGHDRGRFLDRSRVPPRRENLETLALRRVRAAAARCFTRERSQVRKPAGPCGGRPPQRVVTLVGGSTARPALASSKRSRQSTRTSRPAPRSARRAGAGCAAPRRCCRSRRRLHGPPAT